MAVEPLTLPLCGLWWARANVSGLRVRERPVTGQIVGSLTLGQRVTVWAVDDNWAIVQAENGVTGWASREYLTIEELAP